jgi:hypothetical protein
MNGGPVTSRLSAKRGSSWVSGTTSGSGFSIATEQNDTARSSSRESTPTQALCHCRCSSISVTVEIGASNVADAIRVIRSNRSSVGVSRMFSACSALRRSASIVPAVLTLRTVPAYS